MAFKEGDTFTLVDGYSYLVDLSQGITGAGYFKDLSEDIARIDDVDGRTETVKGNAVTFVSADGDGGLTAGQTAAYFGRVSVDGTKYTYAAEKGTLSLASGKVSATSGSGSPAMNTGQYLVISGSDGWTADVTSYDDMVVLGSRGNTVRTGTGSDAVIIEASGSANQVTMSGSYGGVLNMAGSHNTITAAGNIGKLTGTTIGTITRKRTTYTVASVTGGTAAVTSSVTTDAISSGEVSGDSNVVNIGGEGYLNLTGQDNTVSIAGQGAVFLSGSSAVFTAPGNAVRNSIVIGGDRSSVWADGSARNYISLGGARSGATLMAEHDDTVSAEQSEIGIADSMDIVVKGRKNEISVDTSEVKETGEGNKILYEAWTGAAPSLPTVEAAGKNGTVGVSGTIYDHIENLTVSGAGYTVTGGVATAAGSGDKLTVTGGSNAINTRQGDDVILLSGKANQVSLGNGADSITVTGSDNIIHNSVDTGTDTGLDQILVQGVNNTVVSGYQNLGNDDIQVAGGSNVVDARHSNNTALTLTDSGVDNTILGGYAGMKALLTSSAENPTLVMGMGSDSVTIEGAVGGKISTGGGNDRVTVTGGTGHAVDLGTGADEILVRGTHESVTAGTGDDTIVFDGSAAGSNTDGFNYVDLVEDNNLVSINGGDGHTTIMGGLSADTVVFTGGDVEQDVLRMGAGNDFVSMDGSARGNNTSIDAGVGDDSVYAAMAEQLMVDGGTGDDSITLVDARYNTVVAGFGDDSITLGGSATDTSTGYNVVNLGGLDGCTGHNQVSVGGGLTNNKIYGGAERDIIDLGTSGGRNEVTLQARQSTVVAGVRDDTITASPGGKDLIDGSMIETGKEVVLSGYNIADKDRLAGLKAFSQSVPGTGRLLYDNAFIAGSDLVFQADGTVVTGRDGTINAGITPTAGDSGVQAYVSDTVYGYEQTTAVWYATEYGSNMNGGRDHVKVAMVMTGANNAAADTMIGGDLNDTMYAGSGDVAAGGLGNDSIRNTSSVGESREEFGLSTYTGRDTVSNFDGGFSGTDDAVLFYEKTLSQGAVADYKYTAGAGTLTLTNGSGSLVLEMADGSDSIHANVLLRDGVDGAAERLTAIAQNATVTVDDATVAKYYYGSRSGGSAIDVSGLSQGVRIDLGNSGRYFAASENYSYIDAVTGSNGGDNFLVGNGDRTETLTGGNGVFNTLYGGGSANDVLCGGGTDALGVNATDVFYFGQSDGKDVINNIGEGDKVMLYDMVDDGSVTAEAVTFNGGSYLKITNANTGATAFIQASSNDETYEVLFTNGINGEVTSTYQVTGTEITKKA